MKDILGRWASSSTTALYLILCLTFVRIHGLSNEYIQQIDACADDVAKIKDHIASAAGKHETFRRLAELGDNYGHRMSGSEALKVVIDKIIQEMNTNDTFDNVHGENVTIPYWTRGQESANFTSAGKTYPMRILSLGGSIGTNGTLSAEAVVVKTFEELDHLSSDDVRGKIVVYNQDWRGYGYGYDYRNRGATEAIKKGAVGALIRSVADLSINSPHTGQQNYNKSIATKIPVACITIEDAEFMYRLYKRDERISVSMSLEAVQHEDAISQNIVAEIKGSVNPEQVVIFGGHIDTWDVGTGSMDDGGGVMISWEALRIIKKLGLKPKRTLRVVLWTCEEQGLVGGLEYYNRHQNESGNVSLIMESDGGVFKPRGLKFTGSGLATEILEVTLDKYLRHINTTSIVGEGASSDTAWWVNEKKVPGAELYSYSENYFYFHHTDGDTMSVLDADDLDRATELWATTVYVVGMLDDILPRTGERDNGDISSATNINACYPVIFLQLLFVLLWSKITR